MSTQTEECAHCDGYGFEGVEEDTGCAFACYACNTTGRVPLGTNAREAALAAEHARSNPRFIPTRQESYYDHD